MQEEQTHYINSPLGTVAISGTKWHITGVNFVEHEPDKKASPLPLLNTCAAQLKEYFAGKRKQFNVPLLMDGSEFQVRVWQELQKIPFGHLISYEDLALRIRNKLITRAVGHANGQNKISIIIPCHRVVGKNGQLTGYAGGLWRKQWLVEHEQSDVLKF
ncbi:MAG: methylated-DNA--[protein]-cysteine S-methyltransferase [Bacteroidota bacterium]